MNYPIEVHHHKWGTYIYIWHIIILFYYYFVIIFRNIWWIYIYIHHNGMYTCIGFHIVYNTHTLPRHYRRPNRLWTLSSWVSTPFKVYIRLIKTNQKKLYITHTHTHGLNHNRVHYTYKITFTEWTNMKYVYDLCDLCCWSCFVWFNYIFIYITYRYVYNILYYYYYCY